MQIAFSQETCAAFEQAVKFIVDCYSNPRAPLHKPVLFHSLRIAFYLLELGYPLHMVLAALLHDVLEDSCVSPSQVEERFSEDVARIVQAVSCNQDIQDRTLRYQELFQRAVQCGETALIVKAADLLDNSNYFGLVYDKGEREYLLLKVRHFLKLSSDFIGESAVWGELYKRFGANNTIKNL